MKNPSYWLTTYSKPFHQPTDPQLRAVALAKGVAFTLNTCARDGLPEYYANVEAMLTYLYCDLPWSEWGRNEALRFLLSDYDCGVALDNFEERFDYDMRQEFTDALNGRSDGQNGTSST